MSDLVERLYMRSPIPIQQLFVATYGLWWYRRRFNKQFQRQLQEFKSREHWTAEQFREYQETRLRELLTIAEGAPYYRELFRDANIDAQTPPMEALARLPVLSKETLRNRCDDLLVSGPQPKGTIVIKSSGTTGTPTKTYSTPEFHAFQQAVREARNLNWAGVTHHDRRVMFGLRKVCAFDQDRPPFWRYSPIEDMAYASVMHLSPKYLPAYTAFLRKYKPTVIAGFPSALNIVGRYALENNDLPAPAKAILTNSEAVSARMRETIEAAWQCRIFDHYGAVEGCIFASQCEYGSYHISPEVGIVEIVDRNGRPCLPGVTGEVVCTGLKNVVQPLIRYRIGDVASWALDQHCPCGRNLPIIQGIEGRYEDICYTTDGRPVSWFDPVFSGVTNYRESQVIQEKLGVFTVYVVPAKDFDPHSIETIKANMQQHVGEAQTNVELVPAIPRSSSGKFRAAICKLSPEERNAIEAQAGKELVRSAH